MDIIKKFYTEYGYEFGSSMNETDKRNFTNEVISNLFDPARLLSQKNGKLVTFTDKEIKFVQSFIEKKYIAKKIEWKGKDDVGRNKRETTGAFVEYGLLKYFGKESHFDNSIVTNSRTKSYPDLLPLNVCCDIKGASTIRTPLVLKKCKSYTCDVGLNKNKQYKCPNVIGIYDKNKVWLLGIASPEILETYVDVNLNVACENENKIGFYGVDKLIDLPNDWESFKKLSWNLTVIA